MADSGAVYTGIEGGPVLRLTDEGKTISEVADTGASPRESNSTGDGGLVVCDSHRRTAAGRSAYVEGHDVGLRGRRRALVFTNNCSVAADGSVLFQRQFSQISDRALHGRSAGRARNRASAEVVGR